MAILHHPIRGIWRLSPLLLAALCVACETETPVDETGDSTVETASAGCIRCHGCQETLEIEVDPDTGEAEGEESGDG